MEYSAMSKAVLMRGGIRLILAAGVGLSTNQKNTDKAFALMIVQRLSITEGSREMTRENLTPIGQGAEIGDQVIAGIAIMVGIIGKLKEQNKWLKARIGVFARHYVDGGTRREIDAELHAITVGEEQAKIYEDVMQKRVAQLEALLDKCLC